MIEIIEKSHVIDTASGRPYRVPAVGRCHCGREIELDGFTNHCECGALFNSFGQSLVPESQWEDHDL